MMAFLIQLFVPANNCIFKIWLFFHNRVDLSKHWVKKKQNKKTQSTICYMAKDIRYSIDADCFPGDVTPGFLCIFAPVQTYGNLHLSPWDSFLSLASDGFSISWKLYFPSSLYPNVFRAHLPVLPEERYLEVEIMRICMPVNVYILPSHLMCILVGYRIPVWKSFLLEFWRSS